MSEVAEIPPYPADVTLGIELITPELAEKWLADSNVGNRRIRPRLRRVYSEDMSSNRWKFNGETIIFDEEGVLRDGQHRLEACVLSGKPFYAIVVRGIGVDAITTIGGGATRKANDVLQIDGFGNSRELATAARYALYRIHGGRDEFSNAQVAEFVYENPSLVDVFDEELPVLPRGFLTPGLLGYLIWRLEKIDVVKSREFWKSLETLAELPEGSPILALNRRLTGFKASGSGWTMRDEKTCLVFLAWNAWIKGETRVMIKLTRTREGKLIVPEPVSG